MNSKCARAAAWLTVFSISALSASALAVPKAAEHEDAPVTYGEDVPRPRMRQANPVIEPKKAAPVRTGTKTSMKHNAKSGASHSAKPGAAKAGRPQHGAAAPAKAPRRK